MTPDEVKAARLELGMTQAELASALELAGANGKDTVRSWESGKREISGPSRVALRLMLERKPKPASLHTDLARAFDQANRLVETLEGKPGRSLAKETRDRIRIAMETAALFEAGSF